MKAGLFRAWMRLFTLQGSWTHDRLQGIGTGFASEPLLRDLPGGVDGEAYTQSMQRAVRYFNTHPYLAGLAVGAIARAEHSGCDPARIDRLRSALKGPLGSIGDRLVWAGVLPLSSAVGLSIAARGHPVLAVVTFLVLFNAVHIALRIWALRTGWSSGLQVVKSLNSVGLQFGLRIVGPAALLALGFMIPVLISWALSDFTAQSRASIIMVAVAALLVLRWLVPALGAARLGILLATAAILGGWLWPT